MDIVNWVMYVAGGAFGLLTLGMGFSRLSAFTERDINPMWWLGFILSGGVLAIALIVDWFFPVSTIIYLANGSDTAHEVHIDDRIVCIPAKSYDALEWRIEQPTHVTVVGAQGTRDEAYRVVKGTWFINVSPATVSADMYSDDNMSINFDALFTRSNMAVHLDGRYGKPFRMFSQSSFDRIYSPEGDIQKGSQSGPCEPVQTDDKTPAYDQKASADKK